MPQKQPTTWYRTDADPVTKRRRQRRRSGYLIVSGIVLFFGTVLMDQRLQLQVNQIVLSQLSPIPTQLRPPPILTYVDNASVISIIKNELSTTTTTTATAINDSMDYVTTTLLDSNNDVVNDSSNHHSSFKLPARNVIHEDISHDYIAKDDYFQNTNRLPQWFQEYAKWHTETVQHLSIHRNYDDYQYVLLRCVRNDHKCYGTSDRLKMIPVILKLAYISQRLFFIYWSRPFPLEEFLLPNTQYLNWTVPYYMYESLDVEAVQPIWSLGYHQEHGMLDAESQSQRVVRIISMTYASNYYDTHPIFRINTTFHYNDTEDELPMWDVYSDFWRALFIPSSGVQHEILTTLSDLDLLVLEEQNDDQFIESFNGTIIPFNATTRKSHQLLPNINVKPYVSVHIRANYTRDETENHPEENAIRCANVLQQQYQDNMGYNNNSNNHSRHSGNTNPLPIYIASDTSIVTQRAIQYGLDHDLLVVSRDSYHTKGSTAKNPYHIDQPPPETNDFVLHPSDFYDTFVDLYLLAMGKCHTWGAGGYGSWASVLAPKPRVEVVVSKRTSTTNSINQPSHDDICPSIVHNKQKC